MENERAQMESDPEMKATHMDLIKQINLLLEKQKDYDNGPTTDEVKELHKTEKKGK